MQGGSLNLNQTVSSATRGMPTPLSKSESDKVLKQLAELLEKIMDEEDDIEYGGHSRNIDTSAIH